MPEKRMMKGLLFKFQEVPWTLPPCSRRCVDILGFASGVQSQ
jgi:hypothetical protein